MRGPVWVIAEKELLENFLSLRFQISSLLCLLLVTGSALLSAAGLQQELKRHLLTELRRQERLGDGIPMAEFFWRPLPYQKRPSPVAIFASGLETTMTRPIHLQRKWWAGGKLTAGPSAVEAPIFRLFSRPDLVYVVAVVLSLLALITGHDAITREREGGTLKLLLSCPVPRDSVILGKAIGGFASVAIPLVFSLLAAALIHIIVSPLPLDGEGWVRFVWISLIAITYVAAFLFMGIFVSTLVNRSATAIIIGLFGWTLLALLLPHIGPMFARMIEPVDTSSELAASKRTMAKALRVQLKDKYKNERGWRRRRLIQNEIATATANLDEERQRAMIRQLRLGRSISRISPAGAFIFGTTEVSGTGVWSYLEFLEEARRLNRDFNNSIEEVFTRFTRRRNRGGHEVWQQELGPDDLPTFKPRALSSSEGIAKGIWEVFGLACFAVAFFLAGFVAFLRSDTT